MHSNDQHFLIIRTIEDANPAAFWKTARAAPKKIMLEFLGAGLFETVNLASLWVDAGHDMPDGTILSGAVHPLKDHQQRELIGCVVQLLQRAQLFHVFEEKFLVLLLRLVIGIDNRRQLAEVNLFSGRYPEVL